MTAAGRDRPAGVVDYNPRWPADFCLLAEAVDLVLVDVPHSMQHIGSTAVPGLAAKPIIDLFTVLESHASVVYAIKAFGRARWSHEGDGGVPGRDCFRSRPGFPYHHLYLVVRDSEQHRVQTSFRDILRSHPAARQEYEALKRTLAPLLATDRAAYTAGKTNLIVDILTRYGSDLPTDDVTGPRLS